MSYRTFKKLLGETSLERKCRFLFGGGLMLLITGSFYFYARLNSTLVYKQNQTTAQLLISPILMETHWKGLENQRDFEDKAEDVQPLIEELATSFNPDEVRANRWQFLAADPTTADNLNRPEDAAGYDALARIKQGASEVIDINHAEGEYNYYGQIRARDSCLSCHQVTAPELARDDLMGVVKVTLPLDRTESALALNNAILLATAIITAFLAMLAAYAIVRYVIVKPVLHLKDVSDEITRGNLDLRADIRTGDEFEELSHAFNRMLRYLTTVQEELREVNTDLDGKVDELAQVNLRLYEMNKLKDEFLATMSHELRTPLNSILGFSDVLSGAENLSQKQQRFLQNIQTSGKDLMALINDLLDVAKIESGKMEIQCVEFSLADTIERQVAGVMHMADKKNISLHADISPRIPRLHQDPGKLQQILNNLLTNAIKFTPEGGRVRVVAELEPDAPPRKDHRALGPFFRLIVEDTGIGIPLEDQATIFEKFRQGRSIPGQRDTMTREFGGTGLGLSIVKELTKLLGGEVSVESEFGKGSAFMVRLPVRWESVEHLNALGQLNQALDLEPPRLKRNKPAAPETDETAA
jgi:signal transduction histidine kinase